MRYHQFLVEYKRDTTKKQFEKQLIHRCQMDIHDRYSDIYKFLADKLQWFSSGYDQKLSKDGSIDFSYLDDRYGEILLNIIEKFDFTPNKQYTPWIYREFAKGNIRREEDIPVLITDYLVKYHQYKNKQDFKQQFPEFKNIFDVNASDLIDAVSFFSPKTQAVDKGEAEVVHEDDEVRVIAPLDTLAACYYGQGTRWCTTTSDLRNNPTEAYLREGPLYILLPKSPQYPGEKYQLHVASQQFMNEKDRPVNPYYLTARFTGFVNGYLLSDGLEVINGYKNGELLAFFQNDAIEEIHKVFADLAYRYAKRLTEIDSQYFASMEGVVDGKITLLEAKQQYLSMFAKMKTWSIGTILVKLGIMTKADFKGSPDNWSNVSDLPGLYDDLITKDIESKLNDPTSVLFTREPSRYSVSNAIDLSVEVYDLQKNDYQVDIDPKYETVATVEWLEIFVRKANIPENIT